jgi:hypothetical protein
MAELAGDASVLVLVNIGTELGLPRVASAAVVVPVAFRSSGWDAGVGALFSHRQVTCAEVAWHALILHVSLTGAELRPRVAVRVRVAVGAELRRAVLGALVVDRVGVLLAELAGHALLHVPLLHGAELAFHVAVGMLVAGSTDLRDAVRGALVVDRVAVFVAEVTSDTLVYVAFHFGAELGACVAVVVVVTLGALLRDAVLRALVVDRE